MKNVRLFHLDHDVEDSHLHEISVKIEEEDNEEENECYKDISNKGKYIFMIKSVDIFFAIASM